MKLSKSNKAVMFLSIVTATIIFSPASVSAMHIMEGYLPLGYCIAWGAACAPFLAAGFVRLRRTLHENKRAFILLAMSGAYVFVISSFKIPSITGSSSHMTGAGLAAILFGVSATSVLAVIVLIFQAIFIAHGGLTTLGANLFAMGVMGPLLTVALFKAGKKIRINRSANVFTATALGCLFTYCITAFQLAVAYPAESGGVAASLLKFLGVFAPTQIPLAVVEGILTVLVVIGMDNFAREELSSISFTETK